MVPYECVRCHLHSESQRIHVWRIEEHYLIPIELAKRYKFASGQHWYPPRWLTSSEKSIPFLARLTQMSSGLGMGCLSVSTTGFRVKEPSLFGTGPHGMA